jgi:repressor LexA
MKTLTKRQREILEFISDYIQKKGYKPSYQQIAIHFSLSSKAGIAKHIANLEKKGFIRRRRNERNFSIEIISPEIIEESICRVEWFENSDEDTMPFFISKSLINLFGDEQMFAFRVPDDSMIEEHIVEGDIALVERKNFAPDRALVLAETKEQFLIRHYFYQGSSIELRAGKSNSIFLPPHKVKIHGVVRAFLRTRLY